MPTTLEPQCIEETKVNYEVTDIEQFVRDEVEKLDGTTIIIKPITDHWFRVNYIKAELLTPDSIIHNNRIVKSIFVEVIASPDGFVLIDQTKP